MISTNSKPGKRGFWTSLITFSCPAIRDFYAVWKKLAYYLKSLKPGLVKETDRLERLLATLPVLQNFSLDIQ